MNDKPENKVLQREASVGVDLTPAGLSLNAKLRWESAEKGLLGTFGDFVKGGMARYNARANAKNDIKISHIKAEGRFEPAQYKQGESLAGLTESQLEFIEVLKQSSLLKEFESFKKRVLLLECAKQSLEENPPSAEDEADKPASLNEGTLNRLGKRAEEATEAEIREKWAKVLAGEIRKPGTFSYNVLDIIDKMNMEVAKLFKEVCEQRIGNVIFKCLLKSELTFEEKSNLADNDLITSFGEGTHKLLFSEKKINDKGAVWFMEGLQSLGCNFSIPKDTYRRAVKSNIICFSNGDEFPPEIPIYKMTTEGARLAFLSGKKQKKVLYDYIKELSKGFPDIEVTEYSILKDTVTEWNPVYSWKKGVRSVIK